MQRRTIWCCRTMLTSNFAPKKLFFSTGIEPGIFRWESPKLERCLVAVLQDFIVVRLINLQLCQNIYNCSFNVRCLLLETLQGSRLLFHNDIQVIYFLLAVTAFVTRASPWRLHSAYSATIIIEIIIMIINSSKSWVGRTQHQHCRVDFFPVIRPNLRVASLRIARSSTLMSYFKALWNQEEGNKSNKKKNCGHIFTFGIVIWARNKSTNWVLHHPSILKGKKVPVFFKVN